MLLQLPLLVVTTWPWVAVSVIVGSAVFDGGAGALVATTADAAEVAAVDPPALVAVTTTRTVWPTSLAASS